MNLTYRIKRLFCGENGTVLRTAPVETTIWEDGNIPFYQKDHYGNLPQQVTFKNPLGEVKQGLTPLTTETIEKLVGIKHTIQVYKTYRPGEQFP